MSSDPNRQQSPYAQQGDTTADQAQAGAAAPPASTQSGALTSQGASTGSLLGAGAHAEAVPQIPSPAIDLIENSDELWLFIDLPGFQPEEVQLEGDARTVHVSASRPSEIEDGRNILQHERTVQVDRTIQLPVAVDIDEVDAIFEQGVCKMTIPKAASERYRDIDLRTAE